MCKATSLRGSPCLTKNISGSGALGCYWGLKEVLRRPCFLPLRISAQLCILEVKLLAATDHALGPLKFIVANVKPKRLHAKFQEVQLVS